MSEVQSYRKQRQRIHLTVAALSVLVMLMFVSAAFLGLGA